MKSHSRDRVTLTPTAQNLIRILIASYFLALAAGLVSANHLAAPFSPLLPDPWAGRAGCALVFCLAYLIMIGVRLRAAALGLAGLMFAAHGALALQTGLATQIDTLWRDLALIGALMLTYGEAAPRAYRKRGILKPKPVVRRLKPRLAVPAGPIPATPVPSGTIPCPPPAPFPVAPGSGGRPQTVHRGAGSVVPLRTATAS